MLKVRKAQHVSKITSSYVNQKLTHLKKIRKNTEPRKYLSKKSSQEKEVCLRVFTASFFQKMSFRG